MKNLILILVSIPTVLFGQGWERTYGGNDYDYGNSVQQTTDGGYIITGYTTSFGNGWSDVYLIKTDGNGDTLWTKTYGGGGIDDGRSIQQTTDGGYIITGSTSSFGNGLSDVYLIKTDGNGDTLWTKAFGGGKNDIGFSVQQTTDGGYIVTGSTDSFGNGLLDVYLIKTDENGDALWTKTFGGGENDDGLSVQQTADGGYIVTGLTYSFGANVYLIKTDSNGELVWAEFYGGDDVDGGWSGQQTNDGGYIIAGYSSSFGNGEVDFYLVKTDLNGDTLWTRTYGGEANDKGFYVQQTSDGGYILTGFTSSFGHGSIDLYLIKTDDIGDTLWTKKFGGGYGDAGTSVQQTTDGGFIIVGYTESFGNGEFDIYLIKTDENGIVTFTSEIPVPNPNSNLLKIVDLTGRVINKPIKDQPYIEIYDDGTTKKKMKLR